MVINDPVAPTARMEISTCYFTWNKGKYKMIMRGHQAKEHYSDISRPSLREIFTLDKDIEIGIIYLDHSVPGYGPGLVPHL